MGRKTGVSCFVGKGFVLSVQLSDSLLCTLYDMNFLSAPIRDESDALQPLALREPLSLAEKHLQSGSAMLVQQRHHRHTGASKQQLQHSGVERCVHL